MCPHCVAAVIGGVVASIPVLSYVRHRLSDKCRKSDTVEDDSKVEREDGDE